MTMDSWNGKGEEGGRGEKEAATTGREAERRHVSAARPCTRHSEVAHHRADTADGQRDDDTDKFVEGASNTGRGNRNGCLQTRHAP